MRLGLLEQVKAKHAVVSVVVACLVGMAVGSAVTSAFLSQQRSIPSTGLVLAVNLGVYADAGCSVNLTAIDWGSLYPGDSASRTVYVKNSGNTAIVLAMSTNGWNPAIAEGQLSVSWDKGGASLGSGESTAAVLTLSVSASVHDVTSFSVYVTISGSG